MTLVTFIVEENFNFLCKFSKAEHFNEWTWMHGQTFRYTIGTEEQVCHAYLLAFLSAYNFSCKFFTTEPHYVKVG